MKEKKEKREKIDWQPVFTWYMALQEPSMRGQKANLRHCKTLAEIYLQPAYVKLVRNLGINANAFLPIIAAVLAHTKFPEKFEETKKYPAFAQRMANLKLKQERPVISPVRFKQILTCKNKQKLLRLLIRVVKQVEFFDVTEFAKSLYFWETSKDAEAKKWARYYYEILPEEFLT